MSLRSIQQIDLPQLDPSRRVLGVIRPTAECVGEITETRHVGIMATPGTIRSHTYRMEIAKLWPDIKVMGEACPMWVPLVENHECDSPGAEYFVEKHISNLMYRDPKIDSVILGCTHYPLLLDLIQKHMPAHVRVIPQGGYVADSLKDYLSRHPEMEARLTHGTSVSYFTTEHPVTFNENASFFLKSAVQAQRISLDNS